MVCCWLLQWIDIEEYAKVVERYEAVDATRQVGVLCWHVFGVGCPAGFGYEGDRGAGAVEEGACVVLTLCCDVLSCAVLPS